MQDENQGAIVDIDNARRVTFTLNPETFQDSKETNFANIEIPGMSHPKIQFTGGGERVVSFSVFLHYAVTENVPAAIRQLQSWLYPEYTSGRLTKAPPRLLMIFGDTWPDEQWVLVSCNVNRERFNKELECVFAVVDLEFKQYIQQSVDAKDVRR